MSAASATTHEFTNGVLGIVIVVMTVVHLYIQ